MVAYAAELLPFSRLNLAIYGYLGLAAGAPRYLAFVQGLWWDPDPRVFHESWSLCVEEWFYLSFALLAFAGTGRPHQGPQLLARGLDGRVRELRLAHLPGSGPGRVR